MEKKIYVVTSGEYSDYRIEAVFSTRKKANEYVQQKGTDFRIEGYDLDKEVVKETQLWLVEFDITNNEIKEVSPITSNIDKLKDTCKVTEYFSFKSYITFYVEAETMDRAIKIASERFASVKANEYIWLRLTRPYAMGAFNGKKFERFNVKKNEFTKDEP